MAQSHSFEAGRGFPGIPHAAIWPNVRHVTEMRCHIDALIKTLCHRDREIQHLENVLSSKNHHIAQKIKEYINIQAELKLKNSKLEQELQQTKGSSHKEELRRMAETIMDLQGEVSQLKDQLCTKEILVSYLLQKNEAHSADIQLTCQDLAVKGEQDPQREEISRAEITGLQERLQQEVEERKRLQDEKEALQAEKMRLQEANGAPSEEIQNKKSKKRGFWKLFCKKSFSREEKEAKPAAEEKVLVKTTTLETGEDALGETGTPPGGKVEADNAAAQDVSRVNQVVMERRPEHSSRSATRVGSDQTSCVTNRSREHQSSLNESSLKLLHSKGGAVAPLLGKEALITCHLNDLAVTALLDSGAQVSVISRAWKDLHLPDLAVRPMSEINDKKGELKVRTVNGELISFEGWAVVTVNHIPGTEDPSVSISVPFLIGTLTLKKPLIGSNVLERLLGGQADRLMPTVVSLVSNSTCFTRGKAATAVSFIQKPEPSSGERGRAGEGRRRGKKK